MLNHIHKVILIALLLFLLMGATALPATEALADEPPDERVSGQGPDPAYLAAIQKASAMVTDASAQNLAASYGLNILNVTWEDTGRYYDSSVGPNISDVTIQVQHQDPVTGDYILDLMPVIRYPNFT